MAQVETSAGRVVLHEIATQAYNLAMGLQNVAPPQVSTGSSVKYLVEISLKLEKMSLEIEAISMSATAK